jgi:hypothetical protein
MADLDAARDAEVESARRHLAALTSTLTWACAQVGGEHSSACWLR